MDVLPGRQKAKWEDCKVGDWCFTEEFHISHGLRFRVVDPHYEPPTNAAAPDIAVWEFEARRMWFSDRGHRVAWVRIS